MTSKQAHVPAVRRWVAHVLILVFTWSSIAPTVAYAATGVPMPPATPRASASVAPAAPNAVVVEPAPQAEPAVRVALAQTAAPSRAAERAAPLRGYIPKLRFPSAKVRAPYLHAADFKAVLSASARAKTVKDDPLPEDLGESDEVVLTPAIRSLAQTLNNNPVAIYSWVRNNMEFVPTYGAMQSAQTTLDSRRGNAFDLASLTIALLRASGIHARYAYGTIELPAPVANSWVGGATSALATAALLGQGGIPSVAPVTTAGQVSAIQLEHVWVEAYVDFMPSRGALPHTPATWVPIDPSFKQNTITPGVAGAALGGFNAQTLAATANTGATTDANGVTSLNSTGLSSSYSSFTTNAQTAIAGNKPGATVGDIVGTRAVVAENFPFLMGTLPYKTVTVGGRFATVPDDMRWKVRYGVYSDDLARSQGNSLAFIERTSAAFGGRKLVVSFAPSTPSDKQVLDGLLNAAPFPNALPGYQVRVKARLTLDGATVQEGGEMFIGSSIVGGASWFDPRSKTWTDTPSHAIVAGETHALALTVNGAPTATLNGSRDRAAAAKAKLLARDFASLTQDDLTGEILEFAALAYAGTVEANARILRDVSGVLGAQLPSLFRASTVANVTLANGVPQSVRFTGAALDTLVLSNTAVAKDGGAARGTGFQRLLGARASAYAHLVAQRLFTDSAHVGEGASGVKALSRANDAGIKLFTVNSGNVTTIMDQIHVDDVTKDVVKQAALANRRASVTGAPIAISGWGGAGYAIDDPDSGTSEYEITGRYTGAVDPVSDLFVLAMAGSAAAAGQGDLVTSQLSMLLDAPNDMAASIAALNADYRSANWSNWAGAPSVLSAWWLSSIDDGTSPLLGAPLAAIVDGLIAGQVTSLTGLPQPNNAPRIAAQQPPTGAAVGQPYQYLVVASDPDGDPLSFSLVSAPAGMTISSSGLVSWPSPVAGVYQITVRVTDGKNPSDLTWTLTVGDAMSLTLSLAVVPHIVNAGDTVTITVATTGGHSAVTRTLKVDGAAVPLDANGQARVTASGIGGHNVEATATDGTDSLAQQSYFGIGDPADTDPPVAAISTPALDSEITQPTDIVGTATDARMAEWRLKVSPKGKGIYTDIARGTTSVSNAVLGRFDPTTLANGIYDVVLDVVDSSGRTSSDAVTYEVTEGLKLGQFSVSFLDVSVEAAGIPVQVTRTYDTRRKIESLDFGYGWTVDYQNVKLQKNITTGLGWVLVPNVLQLCLRPSSKRKVNVTLPDGRVERFEAQNHQECASVGMPPVDIDFNPIGKTTSTLVATEVPDLIAQGGNLVDTTDATIWNPKKFKLTTVENFVYELDEDFGIRKVTDPSGNTLTYSSAGIVHSSGLSVAFTRDAQGRITTITDPNGGKYHYAYDAAGNLASATDRSSAQSVLKYDRLHTLASYSDPRGSQLVRNEYDSSGRLIAQYDAQGNKIDLSARDPANSKEVVKDRRGATTSYVYDDIGNVTSMTDPYGKITSYTYDARGNEATVTDPLNHTTTKTFDEIDNPTSEKDPLGNTTIYGWTTKTRDLTSIQDARGNTTTMVYGGGLIASITDAMGNSTVMDYKSDGSISSVKDAAGSQSSYEYDSYGRRIKETDATGAVTTYGYDPNGNATTVTKTRTVEGVAKTITTTRVFDADGNVTSETDSLGNVTAITYNALKKIATQTDAAGHTTTRGYEVRGYETSVTGPDGLFNGKTYDENGNVATETDRAGHITTNTYDLLNRLTKIAYADGNFVQNGYDDAGRLVSVTDERGNVTQHEYDAAGRRTKTTDPMLGAWLYEYDGNGNLTKTTDPRLNVTMYEYDKANRRTKTTYPITSPDTVARFESWEYDGAGRRTAWTDTAGNRTEYGYDGAGRLTKVTQPSPDGVAAAPVTTYGYDELGNKVSQTDALNHVTRWDYDDLGRMTKRTLPGGQSESFTYDAVGNVKTHTTFNGDTITFTYDVMNRVATKTVPVPGATGTLANTISYTYTATGQVETVQDNRGTTRYTYDLRDRVKTVTLPEGWTLTYGYDAAGNRTSVATQYGAEAAKTVSFEYDAANRLKRTTSAEGEVTTFTYDAAGNRQTASLPNGTSTTWTYDARNRVTQIEHRKVSDNSLIASHAYLWNAQGARSRETSLTTTVSHTCEYDYTYDRMGRLTQAAVSQPSGFSCAIGGKTWTYTYDAVGNRVTENNPVTPAGVSNFTYDANDRLTGVTGQKQATYEYDAGGNVTKQSSPNPSNSTVTDVRLYRWDADNRLVGFTPPEGQGSAISYVYDAEGELVRETRDAQAGQQPAASDTTVYLADKNLRYSQVLEERDGAGALKVAYQFADGQLIKQLRGGPANYYHPNHLSVQTVTDSTGSILSYYNYSPFGELVATNGAGSTNERFFTGERFDSTIGAYYLRARWLQPALARFTSADPKEGSPGNPISLNDYVYSNDDPVNHVDPKGTETLEGLGAASEGTSIIGGQAASAFGRQIIKKLGCELLVSVADQGINYGIYILSDGANFYVGKSVDINRRLAEHARDIAKQGMRLIASFPIPELKGKAGRDLMRVAEQYVFESMRDIYGRKSLTNVINPMSERSRLRSALLNFPGCK